jgi:phage-related minor tail protein
VEEKLAPAIENAKVLRKQYEDLKKAADDYADSVRKLGGAAGPPQGIKGITPERVEFAKNKADEQDRSVEELRTRATVEARKKYQDEIEQNDAAIRGEQPLLERLGAAYLENSEAVRKAQVQLALYHWEQAHPGASVDQINQTRVQLEQQSLEQRRLSDIELASRYSINQARDEEITRLERAKEVMQEYGKDTLLIDAQIQDAQRQFLQQWDDAAFKVGTFHEKFKAVMNEVALEGQQASERMARSWLTAIDGVNSELAKLATGQKADFKRIVTQLAEDQTKGELQKAEGAILGHFKLSVPGLGQKADGSSAQSALWVKLVDAPPSVDFGKNNPLAGFGIGSDSSAIPGSESSGGGFLSSFLHMFGGFRANGGDMTPGYDYVVGEKGPELLRIPHAGTMFSNADMRNLSTTSTRVGDVHGPTVNQTFNGIKDSDMFRRTTRQEHARMFRGLK